MPILTFTTSTIPKGGVLNSRVLIGRRLSHGVVLDEPDVARLHAWIDPIADEHAEWVITDAGSKTGTFVNDQKITRHPLQDKDRIRVGPITLLYQDQEKLPKGILPVELTSPSGVVRTSGILFECACGAPLWVGSDLAGKRGVCRHCRQPVTVPDIKPPQIRAAQNELSAAPFPAVMPAPASTAASREIQAGEPASKQKTNRKTGVCAVCHSAIQPDEEQTRCPDCAMAFHIECWQENFGCSSYGCPQVNSLAPSGADEIKMAADSADSSRKTPWEPVLLAASIVGSFLGAPAFGSLPALVAIFATVILIRGKAARSSLLIGAVLLCLIGVVAGLGVSDFLYFNARHWPEVLRQHLQ